MAQFILTKATRIYIEKKCSKSVSYFLSPTQLVLVIKKSTCYTNNMYKEDVLFYKSKLLCQKENLKIFFTFRLEPFKSASNCS